MSTQSKNRLGIVTTLAVALILSLWSALIVLLACGVRDGSLLNFWVTIKDGQAQVLSAAVGAGFNVANSGRRAFLPNSGSVLSALPRSDENGRYWEWPAAPSVCAQDSRA